MDMQGTRRPISEQLSELGFKRTPRALIGCPPSEEVEVSKKKEHTHHVITVSGSEEDVCWQCSVTEKELDSVMDALRKIITQ